MGAGAAHGPWDAGRPFPACGGTVARLEAAIAAALLVAVVLLVSSLWLTAGASQSASVDQHVPSASPGPWPTSPFAR
jgi:hypothetical protein